MFTISKSWGEFEALEKENKRLRAEVAALKSKVRSYESDYILPCFEWARDLGIDLEALVRQKSGQNCVALLVSELTAMLRQFKSRIDAGREAWEVRKVSRLPASVAVVYGSPVAAELVRDIEDTIVRVLVIDAPGEEKA